MMFLLTAFSLEDLGILTIFDVIILIFGIYTVNAARRMKKTNVPPAWLISSQELRRIRNPGKFCEQIGAKTLWFGFICILYGIYGLLESVFIQKFFAESAGAVVFLVLIVWYVYTLQNVKEQNFRQ